MESQSLSRSKEASVDCSTVICGSFFTMVLPVLLQRGTRPTWAYPAHYTLAFASSVLPRLLLLTRLAVRSARSRLRARLAVFPCSTIVIEDDLGSLYTPAVRVFASGHLGGPEPDCVPFGPSLKQSLTACSDLRCLRAFIDLTMSPDSSAPPE